MLDRWALHANVPDVLMGMVLMRQKIALAVIPALFTGSRLSAACRKYLQIDHPFWVAAASQLIVAIFVIAVRWP